MHQHRHAGHGHHPVCCSFVPPHILEVLAKRDAQESAEPGPSQRTATVTRQLSAERQRNRLAHDAVPALAGLAPVGAGQTTRVIYDDQNTWNVDVLKVRGEGDPPTAADNVNQAYDHGGAARAFLKDVLDREGADNAGLTINLNVHYGTQFNNAFWDGARMTFGDGDGVIFSASPGRLDVVGHELGARRDRSTTRGSSTRTSPARSTSTSPTSSGPSSSSASGQTPDAGRLADRRRDHGARTSTARRCGRWRHPGPPTTTRSSARTRSRRTSTTRTPDRRQRRRAHQLRHPEPRVLPVRDGARRHPGAGRIWYAGLQNLWPTAMFTDAAAVLASQARILARDNVVPRQSAQVVRSACRVVGVGDTAGDSPPPPPRQARRHPQSPRGRPSRPCAPAASGPPRAPWRRRTRGGAPGRRA